jgi:hypothetical protein
MGRDVETAGAAHVEPEARWRVDHPHDGCVAVDAAKYGSHRATKDSHVADGGGSPAAAARQGRRSDVEDEELAQKSPDGIAIQRRGPRGPREPVQRDFAESMRSR